MNTETPRVVECVLQRFSPDWCREVVVVRDDQLPGGTKTRFLPDVIGDAEEIVFGGPYCGGSPARFGNRG